MKRFSIPIVAAIVVQPFAMYLFLRLLEFGFFVAAGLAAVSAALAGFAVRRLIVRDGTYDPSGAPNKPSGGNSP